jgi:transposase
MLKFKLSKQERVKLNQCIKQEKNSKIYRRLQFLKLKDKGKTHTEIAGIVGVCIDTLTDWLAIYSTSGIDGLCQLNYDGRRPTKLDGYVDQIKQDVKERTITTLTELKDLLRENYNIQIEESWLSRLAQKNSILATRKHV